VKAELTFERRDTIMISIKSSLKESLPKIKNLNKKRIDLLSARMNMFHVITDENIVHDIRTNIRRIYAFEDFFNAVLEQKKDKVLRNKMNKIFESAGKIRDTDITRNYLINYIDRYPIIVDYLGKLNCDKRQYISNFQKIISKTRINKLEKQMLNELENNIKKAENYHGLQKNSENYLKKIEKDYLSLNENLNNIKLIHKNRKKVKMIRYSLVAIKVYAEEPNELKNEILNLHSNLGKIQDLNTITAGLAGFINAKSRDKESNILKFLAIERQTLTDEVLKNYITDTTPHQDN